MNLQASLQKMAYSIVLSTIGITLSGCSSSNTNSPHNVTIQGDYGDCANQGEHTGFFFISPQQPSTEWSAAGTYPVTEQLPDNNDTYTVSYHGSCNLIVEPNSFTLNPGQQVTLTANRLSQTKQISLMARSDDLHTQNDAIQVSIVPTDSNKQLRQTSPTVVPLQINAGKKRIPVTTATSYRLQVTPLVNPQDDVATYPSIINPKLNSSVIIRYLPTNNVLVSPLPLLATGNANAESSLIKAGVNVFEFNNTQGLTGEALFNALDAEQQRINNENTSGKTIKLLLKIEPLHYEQQKNTIARLVQQKRIQGIEINLPAVNKKTTKATQQLIAKLQHALPHSIIVINITSKEHGPRIDQLLVNIQNSLFSHHRMSDQHKSTAWIQLALNGATTARSLTSGSLSPNKIVFAAAPDLSSQQLLASFSTLNKAQSKGLLLHINQLKNIKEIKAAVFAN